MLENRVDNGTDDCHNPEKNQVCHDHRIHLSLDLTALTGGASRVEHNLRVQSGVHDDADYPTRISQYGAAKQRRLQIDGMAFVVDDHRSRELVHQHFRAVTFYLESIVRAGACPGVTEMGKRRDGIPRLEVGLSVQIFSFDERDVVVLARRADENVGRDALVIYDLNEITDAQVLPCAVLPVGSRSSAGFIRFIFVVFGIGNVASRRGSGLFDSFGWSRVRGRLNVLTARLCHLPLADTLR